MELLRAHLGLGADTLAVDNLGDERVDWQGTERRLRLRRHLAKDGAVIRCAPALSL